MKNFQLIAVVLIALFFTSNNAIAQCDDQPTVDVFGIPDITVFFSSDGYCPNLINDVDVSVSGELTDANVTSTNTGNPDCDPSEFSFTFVDDKLGGCPEIIERTWTGVYNNGSINFSYLQIITIEDDQAPVIDTEAPDLTVSIIDDCDETDVSVENESGFAFSDTEVVLSEGSYPGDYTEDCLVSYNGDIDDITYIDVWTALGCPADDLGFIERLWTITDECGNSATDIQTITLIDDQAPVIDNEAPDITVSVIDACDETDSNVETDSGFIFSDSEVTLTEDNYPGDYTEACNVVANGVIDAITYIDVWNALGCPADVGIIERLWTITDECGNSATDIQNITVIDDTPPEITTCPADLTLSLTDACDETDGNIEVVTGFPWMGSSTAVTQADLEGIGGVVDELCDDDVTVYYVDEDPTYFDGNCPNEFLSFVRTWSLEDECNNLSTILCEQTILIFDEEDPVIVSCPGNGSAIEIDVFFDDGLACDDTNPNIALESGFPFSPGATPVDPADFNAWGTATDNCNGGDIFEAEYSDQDVSTGCTLDFIRTWTVTDQCGNTATCSQSIGLVDNEMPLFPTFPDFFYDQGPLGPGGGMWEVESIFCNSEVDITPAAAAQIMDNCSAFGDLMISYTPDITAGPVALVEGANDIMVVITDECNNRYENIFTITMTCVGCGPDDIFEACTDPPTICDLEEIVGFTSCTPEFTTGFGTLCSSFSLDNPSYFEFIAGAEELDFVIEASNCSEGNGIQAMITDPCDATTCYTDLDGNLITQGVPATVAASGLTVGNIYQLVVDGWGGDECNWQILSISALPFAIPDPTPEDAIAEMPFFPGCDSVDDLIFCEGSTIEFWPDTFEEATYFFCWSLDNMNGVSSANGDEDCTENTALETLGQTFECQQEFSSCGPLELTFTEVGVYNLCLSELENGCDNEMPSDYCWEVTIVANGPIDFGTQYVCQHDLDAGWFPDVDGPNGETWQGQTINLEGEYNNFVSDDCGCEFEHIIEVIVLPEVASIVEIPLCIYDLENFYDAGLNLDWEAIEDYYNEPLGSNPVAYLNPLEEGSIQIAYNGIACDTFIFFDFYLFDVPGEITQTDGPICDVILALELDLDLFPDDLIDPEDLNYTWYDWDGIMSTDPTVSVTEPYEYDLIVEYFTDEGDLCSFAFEVDVTDFGTAPSAPTFVESPTETCITALSGIIYSVPPAAGATYIWTVANGTFTPNATGDEITITITDPTLATGTVVCVQADSQCGASPQECETINVIPAPVVELLPVQELCVGTSVNIGANVTTGTASEYFWTIPGGNFSATGLSLASTVAVSWDTPGVYTIQLMVEDQSGCVSNMAELPVTVLAELAPPTEMCQATSNTVTITIIDNPNGTAGSTFSITSGQTATEDNGVITVTGLVPGDEVTGFITTLGGTHPCGDSSSPFICIATDCPLDPAIQDVGAICLDGTEAPFGLVETAGNPGGEWSGPGAEANGNFDPAVAGPGTHIITYEVTDVLADCTATATTSIVIYDSPAEDFFPSVDTVCIGTPLQIAFDNSAGKTYDWVFDDGASTPDTGSSDFDVSYTTPGDKIIMMTVVTGPGCEMTVPHNIYVRPPLVFPGVFCDGSSPVGLGLTWDPILGVVEFEYEILINGDSVETGTTTETDIAVDNLDEGDEVELIVTAIDLNGCSNPVASEKCIAQNCPDFDVVITATSILECWDPVDPIIIQLGQTVMEAGLDAVGTGVWGGSDQIDANTGEFIPAGPGSYVLNYVFSQDVTACQGSESITIDILESPESEFIAAPLEVCIDQDVTFTLDGAAYNANYTYTWTSDFPDTAYDITDNGDGTFTVQFFDEGSGDFNLLTSVAGCESLVSTQSVEVELIPELPILTCVEDLGYILFEWTEVDCAVEYLVFINGVSEGLQTGREYELTGLGMNETVDIEIEIISDCLCDFPSTIATSCTAQDCEDAVIDFDPAVATEYCLSSLPAFTYTAEVTGADIDNSGVFTWSGDGVDADGNVDFTGFTSGFYVIEVLYVEDDCSYTNTITIEVLSVPGIVIDAFNAPCPGALGEVMVNGTGNGPFTIVADGNPLESGLNDLQTGDYNVTVTDANGCVYEDAFSIGTDVEPADDLVGPMSINADSTGVFNYTADVPNLENIVWTVNGEIQADLDCAALDCTTFAYTSPGGGDYEVCTYAYYDGAVCELIECRMFNSIEIQFNTYYIPNVITPDNDMDPVNSTMNIFVEGDAVTILSIGIYDRWGNRVHFNDEDKVVDGGESAVLWDGRFEQGREFTGGVYVYLVEAEIDGFTEYITDDITVVN